MRALEGLGTRIDVVSSPDPSCIREGSGKRFSNMDAVFTEIRIFPCHQA